MYFFKHNLRFYSLTTKIFLFGLLFSCFSVIGQKKSADFHITDAFGENHSLYGDYLDKDFVVVIDLFFTDCPPCNSIAPFIKNSYEMWGSGKDRVQFISLSPVDNNLQLQSFHDVHQISHPSAGIEGGGDEALMQYTNDFFGKFLGYPVLLIINPKGEVIFDIHSNQGDEETIQLLNFHIASAIKGEVSEFQQSFQPNPSLGPGNFIVSVPSETDLEIKIYDISGRLYVSQIQELDDNGHYLLSEIIANLGPGHYISVLKENGVIKNTSTFIIL